MTTTYADGTVVEGLLLAFRELLQAFVIAKLRLQHFNAAVADFQRLREQRLGLGRSARNQIKLGQRQVNRNRSGIPFEGQFQVARSEERRVGKECRSRWS